MNKFETLVQFFVANLFELVILICILAISLLRSFQLISENFLILTFIVCIASLIIKWIVSSYINFMLSVRQNQFFNDNRAVQFLNFDAMKFTLILIALIGVIYLGIQKVLNNETIATLLGGLIGSLLSIKGSFNDLKFTKEEKEAIQNVSPVIKQTKGSSTV